MRLFFWVFLIALFTATAAKGEAETLEEMIARRSALRLQCMQSNQGADGPDCTPWLAEVAIMKSEPPPVASPPDPKETSEQREARWERIKRQCFDSSDGMDGLDCMAWKAELPLIHEHAQRRFEREQRIAAEARATARHQAMEEQRRAEKKGETDQKAAATAKAEAEQARLNVIALLPIPEGDRQALRNRRIFIGAAEAMIPLALGEPQSRQKTRTTQGSSTIYLYPNQTVVTSNGLVVAIQDYD